MEEVIVTVETHPSGKEDVDHIAHLWIGEDEISSEHSTVQNFLKSMQQQGWELVRATVYTFRGATRVKYNFTRPLASAPT